MQSPTPIFVVSMKDAGERRRIFSDRARNAGLEWQFFDACSSLAPGIKYDEDMAKVHRGRPLNIGELGCYSSHYSLWLQLLESGVGQYLILEDDVIADWPMLRRVAETDFTATGVPLLRLYQKAPCPYIVRHKAFLGRRSFLLELLSRPSGTQGYVITRAAAQRLVDYCRLATRPIDDQIDRFWDHGLPIFCLFPFPLMEETGSSSIGDHRYVRQETSVRRRIYARLDRAKHLAAIFRRRRHRGTWDAVAFSRPA